MRRLHAPNNGIELTSTWIVPAGVEIEQFECFIGGAGAERRQFGLEGAGQLLAEVSGERCLLLLEHR